MADEHHLSPRDGDRYDGRAYEVSGHECLCGKVFSLVEPLLAL